MNLSLKIVTPEKAVFDDQEITSATFPTEQGEITILPNHIPLLTKIITGEVILRKKDKEMSFVVADGFLKLEKDGNILLLADYAIRSEDIEVQKVEEAKKRAEASLKEKRSQSDFVIAEAELRRTLMELRVSQKRRSGKNSK